MGGKVQQKGFHCPNHEGSCIALPVVAEVYTLFGFYEAWKGALAFVSETGKGSIGILATLFFLLVSLQPQVTNSLPCDSGGCGAWVLARCAKTSFLKLETWAKNV